MRCLSYKNGKLSEGITVDGSKLKTCAIKVNVPCDWDTDKFIDTIREKKLSDILLYSCSEIIPGDSKSSIFPEDCVLVRCTDPINCESGDNCMDIAVSSDHVDFVLFSGGSILDRKTKNYVVNESGELSVSTTVPAKPERAEDDYTILL